MRRLIPLLLLAGLAAPLLRAQEGVPDAARVCIYVDNVPGRNAWLNDAQRERLRAKLVLAASKGGMVHVGLSSFLLFPQLDIVDVRSVDAGMKPMTVAKLELILQVARLDKLDAPLSEPGTIFDSATLTLVGQGNDTTAAVNSAIGSLSASDPNIAALIKQSRQRIMDYYMNHCSEVTAEAARAYELQNYAMSIALFYSIPEGTPCFESARELSVLAYREYEKTKCQERLLQLRASSVIQSGPDVNPVIKQQQYAEVLRLIRSMNPTAEGCYEEAYNLLNALAIDFDTANKQSWEKTSKLITEKASVDRERYKAMAEISSKQQPGPFTFVLGK